MCDMVRVLTHIECSHIVLTHRVLTHTSGPRTRPKNSAQELLLCVLFFRLVMCDVWCIRPKNSAQELVLCVLFFRLVMCDVWCIRPKNSAQELGPRTGVSGPRTRPKNFFSVFFSFGTHGETGQKQVRNGSETTRPKNSAQELFLCVLFFRLVMCDVWCGDKDWNRSMAHCLVSHRS